MLTTFSIFQFVKDKLKKTEKDSPEYNALFEVYNFIRVNMNSMYGMGSGSTSISESIDDYDPDWYAKERAAQFLKHELEEEK